jgi:hypothetical protein
MLSQVIEAAVTRFLDTLYPDFEEMAQIVNLRDGIDFVETLSTFFNINLVALIKCVLNTPNAEFSPTVLQLARRILAEFVATCRHCFSDDHVSIERLIQNRLDLLSGDVSPAVRQWTMTSAMGHMRSYAGSIDVPETVVAGYVVRNADGRLQQSRDGIHQYLYNFSIFFLSFF